ncbi:MAG: peptidoglycan DD-metalloendopeptidase family protein [Oscillospiraceae bacterium]|nr:peptidoglycan DD-metalloendopeptidase family protein [Oscillospiraceae bacterium]
MKKMYSKEAAKKSGKLSFFLVMMLCTAMIGASCWFAYTQTARDITLEIDSITDMNNRIAAAVPETNVPKPETNLPSETTEPRAARAVTPAVKPTEAFTQPVTEPMEPPVEQTAAPAEPVQIPARMPCNGEILQPYSNGELVKSATTGVWQTHNGVDIAAAAGDPVYPMEPGIVTDIEENALWGICIVIDHENGMYSRYCGLAPGLEVSEGDQADPNEPIGYVGNTAEIESALPPHLHFEVRQGEHLVDPVSYLGNLGR